MIKYSILLIMIAATTLIGQQIPIHKKDHIVPDPGSPVWNLGEAKPHCPEWDPTSGKPYPLSSKEAVDMTLAWIVKKYPHVAKFEPVTITLSRLKTTEKQSKIWLYSIEFREVKDDQLLDTYRYIAYIAGDGTILEPKIAR